MKKVGRLTAVDGVSYYPLAEDVVRVWAWVLLDRIKSDDEFVAEDRL